MAKKRKTKTARKSPRRNPSRRPKGARRTSRRRNPGTYAERAGKLLAGAAVALATGAAVYIGSSKIMPGSKTSLYGIPALVFLAGVGVARTMPTLGVGMCLGSFAPFALPLASKALAATSPSTPSTTAGMARVVRNLRAVSMGRSLPGMRAVDMGAVDMGAYRYG